MVDWLRFQPDEAAKEPIAFQSEDGTMLGALIRQMFDGDIGIPKTDWESTESKIISISAGSKVRNFCAAARDTT